ncbi:MAG: hypothetical protein IKW99_05830 [Bacteroidales bacterium]|nr:hypothetical protein [Bacteroidales bacterium]
MNRAGRNPRYAGIKEYLLEDVYPSDMDIGYDSVGAKDMGQDIQKSQFPGRVPAVLRSGTVRLAIYVRVVNNPAAHQMGVPEHSGTHIVKEQYHDEEHRDRTLGFLYN